MLEFCLERGKRKKEPSIAEREAGLMAECGSSWQGNSEEEEGRNRDHEMMHATDCLMMNVFVRMDYRPRRRAALRLRRTGGAPAVAGFCPGSRRLALSHPGLRMT